MTEKKQIRIRKPTPLRIYILSQNRSLYSTRRLFEEATLRGHHVKVLPPLNLALVIDRNHTEVYFQKKFLKTPAAVIPRIGQRKSAYMLSVLRQFELMGAKALNASQAMERCRDKFRSLQILSRANIGIPRTFFLDDQADIDLAIQTVGGAPLIIKFPQGTQGKGVMLAESNRSARSMMETMLARDIHILVQEFIQESDGEDTRVIMLGENPVAVMKRRALEDDFRSNVHLGGEPSASELSIEVAQTARKAVAAVGLDFAGVDLVNSDRGPLVLEVNPSPGIEGIEKVSHINIAEKCIAYIEKRLMRGPRKDSVGY